MSRIKCSECGKLAHSVVEGKAYCMDCVPEPTMPVAIEETFVNEVLIEKVEKPKPSIKYFKSLAECIEKKKPWYKKVMAFLDDRRPK